MITGLHLAAELLSHGLHAIANTQHRYARAPNAVVGAPRIFLSRRLRPTGQNDGSGAKVDDLLLGYIARINLAIHHRFHEPAEQSAGCTGCQNLRSIRDARGCPMT